MEIIIQPTADDASMIAARHVARLVRDKPHAVLGLATGSTPLPMYRELVRMHKEQGLDFSGVTTFNLDEYVGLPPEHPASYHAFMWENFFGQINVQRERVHIPDGLSSHIPAFCRKYEEAIVATGGIDLQVLGIGSDGHIGFNEPSSSLASRTRIKTLTAETRRDNAQAFGDADKVPFHVVTMGVGTIMDARHVIILAFGDKKAEAIAGAVEGPITAMNPASILQMHPVATCIIDEGAATKLARTEYYRWVYDRKPDWQKL
ncbi:MAG: glucosamine-6-phosphate deaminase [Chthoniobacter sp.]|uniref:glucosamine-6-phosphate deaminase n=1 Tax=Chthoniobacter sp. TaxID=2510640 RepID=UPI0032A59C7E